MLKRLLLLSLFASTFLLGQTTTHSATLTWVDTQNPATGTTYSVYRVTGLCSGSPTFAKIATALAVKTYVDTTVQPGPYCFQVTATFNAVESAPSGSAAAAIPAFAPSGLTIQVARIEMVVPGWSLFDGGYLSGS